MALYDDFLTLNLDLSPFDLGRGPSHSDYFCTPCGAEAVGWAGVDGIHYCFIQGFGEMVFAVNPSNLPGSNVYPLARNFRDFLCLLLSCHGLAAAEQAHLWSREEFNAFLEEQDPPTPEQSVLLNSLRERLNLIPTEDPYGYIRDVQDAFDDSKLTFPPDYYECLPVNLETPEQPPWAVYYDEGFSSLHRGRSKPGKEIPVNKTFTWCGNVWHIPALYLCGKGVVLDLCMEIEPDALRTFEEKWQARAEKVRELTPEEQDLQEAENPTRADYSSKLTVNGKELRRRSGNGFCWTPVSCRSEWEQGEPNQQDWEALWLMEHYGLDTRRGWLFCRDSFPLGHPLQACGQNSLPVSGTDPCLRPRRPFYGIRRGDEVSFLHPINGTRHTLHVVEYEANELDPNCFQEDWECPTHYTVMTYTVDPELPPQTLSIRDCWNGDHPRSKSVSGMGPTASGSMGVIIGGRVTPSAIVLDGGKSHKLRAACSSLSFTPPDSVTWRMVFYQKTAKDIALDLLPQNESGVEK